MRVALGLVIGAAVLSSALPQSTPGARELYYFGATEKDNLPPVHKASVSPKGSKAAPQAAAGKAQDGAGPAATASPALHLGLLYSLMLLNEATSQFEPVDSGRVFHKGECIALDINANRSGYLYVLAKESSGAWHLLIPSPEMPDQTPVLDPGHRIRAPQGYCFSITDPPGTETLFVVLSRDPRDFQQLYDGVKGLKPPSQPSPKQPQAARVEVASSQQVESAVARMSRQFGTRDLVIRKVAQVSSPQETADSVYVVNGSDRPASTVVTQILVRHR